MLRLAAEGLTVTVLVLTGLIQSLCLTCWWDGGIQVKHLRQRRQFSLVHKPKPSEHDCLTVCIDWKGAALTLMPLLWGALETGWKTCVWGADGRAAEGGDCSDDRDMEVWWKGETSFKCLFRFRATRRSKTLNWSFGTAEELKKKKTVFLKIGHWLKLSFVFSTHWVWRKFITF